MQMLHAAAGNRCSNAQKDEQQGTTDQLLLKSASSCGRATQQKWLQLLLPPMPCGKTPLR
jgi:hypothetical protein